MKIGIALLCCIFALYGQTIEEKRDTLLLQKKEKQLRSYLQEVNSELKDLRLSMEHKYQLAREYHDNKACEEEYHALLVEINQMRDQIIQLEKKWRNAATDHLKEEDGGYALWDQEETSISQLIMEYGSHDYLYIIPSEILSMTLHIHSEIPIPRESWNDLLTIILSHNGIGIKPLNAYAKQLYLLKQDLVAVDHILNDRMDLIDVSSKTRVVYVFSPPPERIKGVAQFFERFRDPKVTFIYQVGYKIAIIASKEEIEKLLALYDTVWEKGNQKYASIIPLTRIKPSEMEKILVAYFGDLSKKLTVGLTKGEGDDLEIFPIASEGSLVLIGPKDMVERGKALVKEIEGQIEDPMAMTVYWYNCRHSDPIDLAQVLEKVYTALIYSGIEGQRSISDIDSIPPIGPTDPPEGGEGSSLAMCESPTYSTSFIHPPTAVAGTIESQKEKSYTTNFIPYPKTGAIMMVVRRDTLDKLKELIEHLDIPKKMVQIEVLLFEKRIKNHNNFGLNLLRLGSAATNTHETGLRYETNSTAPRKGIMDFFIFRKKLDDFWPAFDIAYSFLMAQEDIQINAAPSVTTLNQMPAQISLVEEISIDNGAAPMNASNGTIVYQQSYSRTQYGTTIVITPTIHDPEYPDGDKHFVTLETNVTFDTIKKNIQNDRPTVSKRHIQNHVRVVDGETIILGGLREKTAEDSSNKLPFLGELPGIGKFFGDSKMTDEETEIFFFITPHIVLDAKGEMDKLRRQQLTKRPGDFPEFLACMEDARKRNKKRFFDNSLKLLFGKIDD